MGEIDGALAQRLVEVTALDQDQVEEVAGEFEQQPFARIVLPGSEQTVTEPSAVAVAEAELHRGRGIPEAAKIAERFALGLPPSMSKSFLDSGDVFLSPSKISLSRLWGGGLSIMVLLPIVRRTRCITHDGIEMPCRCR